MSAQEMTAVLKEIAPPLTGGWIQKVYQPVPRLITLDVRTAGRTLSLLISADPDTARLHLAQHRYPNPPSPPPFCQFLRAHIQGARVERLEQVPDDRIVRLRLATRHGPCSLIAALTGKGADLLLLDAGERILAALDREAAGKDYHLPAPRPHGPEFVEAKGPAAAGAPADFPISAAIERQYRQRELGLAAQRLRQATIADLKKRIKKAARRADALRADLEKASRYHDYARYGELLKANLSQMHKGQDRFTVIDYFDPALPELVLPLDPSKSPHGNMEDYFKKHRKYMASEREVRPRLESEEQRLAALRAELREVERGTRSPESLPPPVSSARPHSQDRRPAPTKPAARSGPFRRFLSADGVPIYVGRNARENELLTFGEARPDDVWLHAHGTPGSHVVIRLEKGVAVPPETIRDAATLALLYSDLKKSGKGEVIYTKKKYVRKVKAKSPGTVTVTQEKTIFVTLDRARLDRLKDGAP